jgi:hypothetical protein
VSVAEESRGDGSGKATLPRPHDQELRATPVGPVLDEAGLAVANNAELDDDLP